MAQSDRYPDNAESGTERPSSDGRYVHNGVIPNRLPVKTKLLAASLGVAGAVLISLLLFSPVLGDIFLSDDFLLLRGLRTGGPFGILTFRTGFFRPLAALSLWLDLRMFGLQPAGFHVVNVLLHATTTLAVWMLGRELGLTRLTASIAALWFLTAPVHSEPVSWICCRMDLLAASTGLWSLWAWLASRREAHPLPLGLALGLLVCALLSKEAAAPLCLVLLAWELLSLRQSFQPAARRTALLRMATVLLLIPVYLTVRRLALGQWVGGYGQVHTRFELGQIATKGILFTVRALTGHFPAEKVPLDRPLYGVFSSLLPALSTHPVLLIGAALAGLGLVALGIVALRNLRWSRSSARLGFIALAYALSMVPVVNLSVSTVTVEGERFLYLPSAFLFLLVSALLERVALRVRTRLLIAGTVSALYVLALQHALKAWHEAGTLTAALLPEIAAARQKGPMTLVNIPESIRGAYVFRNGLEDALFLLYAMPQPMNALVSHMVLTPQELVHVEGDPGHLKLSLGDKRSWIFDIKLLPGMSVATDPLGQNQIEIRGVLPANLYVYSGGHIKPITLLPAKDYDKN